jgi:hypothetical protein
MKLHAFAALIAILIMAGCAGNSNVGGLTVSEVSADTKDDLAACGMGISSSTGLKAGASIEKNGGKLETTLNDELKTAFVSKFGEKDALAAMDKFTTCMEGRHDKRSATKKQASMSACKASWTCDMNVVAGFCTCNKTTASIGKEQGWSEAKTAQEIKKGCTSTFDKCWPAGDLNSERSKCETVLAEARVPMLTFNSATCKPSIWAS